MSEPFELSSDPPPSERTLRGRRERQGERYQKSNVAYDVIETLVRAIRREKERRKARKEALPKTCREALGVPSLFALLLRLRKELRRLLRHYGETSIRALFSKHYGRTPPYFQFHHETPPREFDMENEEDRKRCCNVENLRLVTAEENLAIEARKRRGEDDPAQLWLFPNLRHDD